MEDCSRGCTRQSTPADASAVATILAWALKRGSEPTTKRLTCPGKSLREVFTCGLIRQPAASNDSDSCWAKSALSPSIKRLQKPIQPFSLVDRKEVSLARCLSDRRRG